MRVVFADTLYWVALLNVRDPWHARAVHASEAWRRANVVTTDAVLLEVLASYSEAGPAIRLVAAAYVRSLYSRRNLDVVPHDRALMLASVDLYAKRPDKSYSLVDCTSMLVMRERGIHQVLTNDHHFAQEGFEVLIPG